MKKVSYALAGMLIVGSTLLASNVLESVKVSTVGSLDGGDAAWAKAKALTVLLDQQPYKPENYKGIKMTNVEIKSVYDAQNVYFKVQYDDPTQSFERQPWIKQADGTWKMKKNQDETGHENTYYEDKFAMFWDINAKGFEKKGCAIACHLAKDGVNNGFADKSPGRKYTRDLKETIDMWHWKSVRTSPVGQVDDQFVNGVADPAVNKDWGRSGDEKTAGGYKDNVNKEKTAPSFMSKNKDHKEYWIVDADKVPFVDTFKAGDRVPSMIVSSFEGSRADITSKAQWENGKWTIVMKRALVTTHPKSAEQDVQFSDLKKSYPFGVAVFDNSAIDHVYHDGSLKLTFK